MQRLKFLIFPVGVCLCYAGPINEVNLNKKIFSPALGEKLQITAELTPKAYINFFIKSSTSQAVIRYINDNDNKWTTESSSTTLWNGKNESGDTVPTGFYYWNVFGVKYDLTIGNSGGLPGPLFDGTKYYGGAEDDPVIFGDEGFQAIYVDENENIYVRMGISSNYGIGHYSAITGKPIKQWVAYPADPSRSIQDIVGDSDFLYVATNQRVVKSEKANVESIINWDYVVQPEYPKALALRLISNTTYLFVGCADGGIWKYQVHYDTSTQTDFTEVGTFITHSSGLRSLALDSDNLLYALGSSNDISVYDSTTGATITDLTGFNPPLTNATDICIRTINGNEYLFIADYSSYTVKRYPLNNPSNGKIVVGLGEFGFSEYHTFPYKMWVTKNGDIYVANGAPGGLSAWSIQKFPYTLATDSYSEYSVLSIRNPVGTGWFGGIDESAIQNRIWIQHRRGLLEFDVNTTFVTSWRGAYLANYSANDRSSLFVHKPSGKVFFCFSRAENNGWCVFCYDGAILDYTPYEPTDTSIVPYTLCISDNYLYVVGSDGAVKRFDLSNPPNYIDTVLSGFSGFRGIIADDDFLYICDYVNQKIRKFNKADFSEIGSPYFIDTSTFSPCKIKLYHDYLFVSQEGSVPKLFIYNRHNGNYIGRFYTIMPRSFCITVSTQDYIYTFERPGSGNRIQKFQLCLLSGLIKVDDLKPEPVTDLEAQPGGNYGEIVLTWTTPSDDIGYKHDIWIASYVIKYSSAGPIDSINWGDTPYPTTTTVYYVEGREYGSIETFTISGLIWETTYYFAIQVKDKYRESDIDITTPRACAIPKGIIAPQNFTGVALTTDSIRWSWNLSPHPDVDSYYFLRYLSEGDYEEIAGPLSPSTSFYLETGLNRCWPYYRIVKVVLTDGRERVTSYKKVYTLPGPIWELKVSTKTDHTVTLTWKGDRYAEYEIKRASNEPAGFFTVAKFSKYKKDVNVEEAYADITYVDEGLDPESIYCYLIYSYNPDEVKYPKGSEIETKTLRDTTAPPEPKDILIEPPQEAAIKSGDLIDFEAKIDPVDTESLYDLVVLDQGGNVLEDIVEYSTYTIDGDKLLGSVLLGDIFRKYPGTTGIRIAIRVVDASANISKAGESDLIVFVSPENYIERLDISLPPGKESAMDNDKIPLSGKTLPGLNLLTDGIEVFDQLGNKLEKEVYPEISISTVTGDVSGFIRLGNILNTYPDAKQLKIKITVEDRKGNTSFKESNFIKLMTRGTFLYLYDNIFNPIKEERCKFVYQTTVSGNLEIEIYSLEGMLIRKLFDGYVTAPDIKTFYWDGRNDFGELVSSDLYIVHTRGPRGFVSTKKIVVVK